MVLDGKKMPKDVYDWLVEEAFEFHEGDEEVMKKVKKGTDKSGAV